MARLIYGVSGEGSGHSSRAREVLRHLSRQGHEVKVASYDRGYANLKDEFDVHEIEGLHIAVDGENRVSKARTLTGNLRRLPDGVRGFREMKRKLFREFEPEAVITDFEPQTAWLARHEKLPLYSIDNQHRMRWMSHPIPPELERDARMTRLVIRSMVPSPDKAFITTFWFGETNDARACLVPPILRSEVRALKPSEGDHILVYFTKGFDGFIELLKKRKNERFFVYGSGREGSDGPLEFRPFSKQGFLDDLAGARAVISTAGFTLMTESLFLKKPLLALPMQGQFEQELNSILLEHLELGQRCTDVEESSVDRFFERLPDYTSRLAEYEMDDENRSLFTELDRVLPS